MNPGERILITGGAGFVGSNLAVAFRNHFPDVEVLVLDNLSRRGSEFSLKRLKDVGVQFHHGDIRCPEDFEQLPKFQWLIDCSAEPSVHAGAGGSPKKVLDINLCGTINCLEAARKNDARFLFLSTSRVYPISGLGNIPFQEDETRFSWNPEEGTHGCSKDGIQETFPLEGARSFYGASKLSSELLIHEYCHSYGMSALINRCGVLAGPWQMGKVDQGVISLWVARHYFEKPLKYIGYGGTGKQVRDVLHVDDLFQLLVLQMKSPEGWKGQVFNAGGGLDKSVSLCELTELCQEVTQKKISILPDERTNPLDVRIYVTDNERVSKAYHWQPQHSVKTVVENTFQWITENESDLSQVFA